MINGVSGLPLSNGKPFRAMIVAHNWHGGTNLCVGAEGYSEDSFVVLPCSTEDLKRFPIGTKFDLVRATQ